MNTLDPHLKINNCPHCSQYYPNLALEHIFNSNSDTNDDPTLWGVYICKRCGWATLVVADTKSREIKESFPEVATANIALPDTVKHFLNQAMQTVHSPSASILMSNSAIDAMLREKGYKRKKQSLYDKIEAAGKKGLLTQDMVTWAHQVRLDSNDQRHVGENATDVTLSDAKKCLDFAKILGEILFVIPNKVTRHLTNSPQAGSAKNKKLSELIKIRFPAAYRNRSYSHRIILDNSDEKPVVTASARPEVGTGLIPIDDLDVFNVGGYPNRWYALFKINDPSKFPQLSRVEIKVDGIVTQVGQLNVNQEVI